MAKPALESLGALEVLGQRRHWVLVLDGSMSMDYAVAETTRFDQSKQIAADWCRTRGRETPSRSC